MRLQNDYKISASEIAKFTKGYMHYKSWFDAIRAKNKPKIPKELDEFNFDNKEFDINIPEYTQGTNTMLWVELAVNP